MVRLSAWLHRNRWFSDLTLALLLAPLVALSGLIGWRDNDNEWTALLVGLGFVVPLAFRGTRPELAAALSLPSHLLQLWFVDNFTPGNLAVPLVLYSVAAHADERRGRRWLWVALIGALLAAVDWVKGDDLNTWLGRATIGAGCVSVVLAAWFLGRLARERVRTQKSLAQRAEALELQREQEILLAAGEERARIAREMHDLIAHSLAVIVVQCDGARYLLDGDSPAETRLATAARALEVIDGSARAALSDTRRLVGVLRADGAADLAPSHGLADIPSLVEDLRTSGVAVDLQHSGARTTGLGEGAGLAAYRIVQEALTNVLRHARGARVQVEVLGDPSGVTLTVTDDGPGAAPGALVGGGHGLVGMRERVAAFGGELRAGNLPDHGFRVWAWIPAEEQR